MLSTKIAKQKAINKYATLKDIQAFCLPYIEILMDYTKCVTDKSNAIHTNFILLLK